MNKQSAEMTIQMPNKLVIKSLNLTNIFVSYGVITNDHKSGSLKCQKFILF